MVMSEEEIIDILENVFIFKNTSDKFTDLDLNAIKGLLDLYNKQKQELDSVKEIYYTQSEVEQLANGIRVLGTNPDITTEEIIKEFTEKPITEEYMEEFKSRYISKDKVLKEIGYEEDDEEYDRLKQDDEKLLAILDTLYSEVCRLEDIEDKKVEVAVDFIEEKRDKYWQDKIRDKIKELEEKEKNCNFTGLITECEIKIETLEELLEEKL